LWFIHRSRSSVGPGHRDRSSQPSAVTADGATAPLRRLPDGRRHRGSPRDQPGVRPARRDGRPHGVEQSPSSAAAFQPRCWS
jgi:hypothetical protein